MISASSNLHDIDRPSVGKCPAQSDAHAWRPPHGRDVRSPCPALNTLANHGYINRDGKNLCFWDIVCGLRDGYNLTMPLAFILAFGGFFLLRQWGRISLSDLARHNCVEHNASLAHDDTRHGDEYAPTAINRRKVEDLVAHVPRYEHARLPDVMTPEDVGDARVRREKASKPLDSLHAEIARGEMALVCGMWETNGAGGRRGIPVAWLEQWFIYQRLPRDWERKHTQGLWSTVRFSIRINMQMKRVWIGSLLVSFGNRLMAHDIRAMSKSAGVLATVPMADLSASVSTNKLDRPIVPTVQAPCDFATSVQDSDIPLARRRRAESACSDI